LFKDAHLAEENPLTVSVRAQLKALQAEVGELLMKTEFLGKAAAFFAQADGAGPRSRTVASPMCASCAVT